MKRILLTMMLSISTILFVGACSYVTGKNDMASISGEVFYKQRIALPKNAKVTITLADVSLADASHQVISRHSYITKGKQVPLPFELNYSTAEIEQGHTYTVSASIEIDGKRVFVTDTAYPVINDASKTKHINIQVVSAAP